MTDRKMDLSGHRKTAASDVELGPRRALIVGVDDYPGRPLTGCVNDATRVREALERNADGSPNFECTTLLAGDDVVDEKTLRRSIRELFEEEADVALFYFAGHGIQSDLGGFLVTQDAEADDEGVDMSHLLAYADHARQRIDEVFIILDCCHSGHFGGTPVIKDDQALLRQGVSVLTAARPDETAKEERGSGVFTTILCDALNGGAADLVGNVTVGSVYAHIDQSLGPWEQRPLFKSHVSRFVALKKCEPVMSVEVLRSLATYFRSADAELPLDPSFEPDAEPKNPDNEKIFGNLQRHRAARLVEPIGEEHMYFAAMNSGACRLTPLGRYYWNLAAKGRI